MDKWLSRAFYIGAFILAVYVVGILFGRFPMPAGLNKFLAGEDKPPTVKNEIDLVNIKINNSTFLVTKQVQGTGYTDYSRQVGILNQITYVTMNTCYIVEVGYDFKNWPSDYAQKKGNIVYVYMPKDRVYLSSVRPVFNWNDQSEALKYSLPYDSNCFTRAKETYNGIGLLNSVTADNMVVALANNMKFVFDKFNEDQQIKDEAYQGAFDFVVTMIHGLPGYESADVRQVAAPPGKGGTFSPSNLNDPTPTPTIDYKLDYKPTLPTPTPIGIQSGGTIN